MKITQTGRAITADFTELQNQYSSGTIEIDVEFTDTEFNDWGMFYSCQILNFESYNYISRLVNNKIVLPLSTTYYAGIITISLYGVKGELVKTTNNIPFNVVESNPTADQVQPISTDWAKAVREYADAYTAEKISKITPTISATTKNWLIGGVDTGILAQGHNNLLPATTTVLGGVKVGNGLNVDSSGVLTTKNSVIVNTTLLANSWVNNIQKVAVAGVSATTNQDVLPIQVSRPTPTTSELAMIEAFNALGLKDAGQEPGFIYLYCETVPTTNIQIRVIVRGA